MIHLLKKDSIFTYFGTLSSTVSGIGAVVKVIDSHPYGRGSIPGKGCMQFSHSIIKQELSTALHVF